MSFTLDDIRSCLDGVIPGCIATRDAAGEPNLAYLSQVQYVDAGHVALSYQFFNTTRRNILACPRARVSLIDPHTAAQYRLSVEYLRTETAGPLFEGMKAKLAGIASHSGMDGVFRLLGSDVYRVLAIETVPGHTLPPPPPRHRLLSALRAASATLCAAAGLEDLLGGALDTLQQHFGIGHAMLLMADAPRQRLYTVASRGYADSGVGSEIPFGDGVIGVAARERSPIRIGYFAAEYSYARSIALRLGVTAAQDLEVRIPLPGLPEARSQLAVPILACGSLIGVLYVESPREMRFGYDDEDALVSLAGMLGNAIALLQQHADRADDHPPLPADAAASGPPLNVRHYAGSESIFLDDDYLIKGVAGAILWALLRDYSERGRRVFTTRELRLDPRIRLPDVSDNLEARLILLARRLAERSEAIRLEKCGRGRIELQVARPLSLQEVIDPEA